MGSDDCTQPLSLLFSISLTQKHKAHAPSPATELVNDWCSAADPEAQSTQPLSQKTELLQ